MRLKAPLKGKRILITGAGSGIGRALAIEAAKRGAVVALAGRRLQALEDTRDALVGDGHLAIPLDVTQTDSRAELRIELGRVWGHVDLLVNNAGTMPGGPLSQLSDEALQAAVATNLGGPIALTRDLLPLLRAANGARVVNLGSMFGQIPYPLFATYSATKAGLRAFSIALRRELKPLGIAVTHAAPRATMTAAASPFQRLARPFGMTFDPPDRVAHHVWNRVERGADAIYPRGPEPVFALLQALAPRLIDAAVHKQLLRAQSDVPLFAAGADSKLQGTGAAALPPKI